MTSSHLTRGTPQALASGDQSGVAPARLLAALCAVQFVLWSAVPALLNRTPPTDTLESFLWGREGIVLSYKHPQLPGWTLQVLHYITGDYVWAGFLSAQLAVCMVFPFVYALGRDMMGGRAAIAGVLLLPVTGFFSWGTRQFNHDVAQMPFWAAIAWLLWRAERENKTIHWLVLGLVAGASLYAKFTSGLIILFGVAWLLFEPQARRRMTTRGPWIAMFAALGVSAPIFIDMNRMGFIQLTYATVSNKWSDTHQSALDYIGIQIALFLVFPMALWSVGLIGKGARTASGSTPLLEDPRARRYLVWMGLGPPLLLAVASLFTGIGEAWSKPMYSLVGLVSVAYLGRRLNAQAMRRLTVWGFGMIAGTVLVYAIFAPTKCYLGGMLSNTCLPGREIAAQLQRDWHTKTGTSLGVVAGEEGLMMPTALFASDKPSMLTQFNSTYSPWVTPERLARQGMLIVWGGAGPPPAQWSVWTTGRAIGRETFRWARGWPPYVASYIIIPPGTANLPPLINKVQPNTM